MKRACVLLVALAGCNQQQSILAPVNDPARQLAGLGWIIAIGFSAVSLVMWILLVWAAARRRGTFEEHEPVGAPEGGARTLLVGGGLVVPSVVFGALLVLTILRMHTASPEPMHMHAHADATMSGPRLRVVGHRWWWEVHYLAATPVQELTTANEIHIPVGQTVDIELQSADVIHSFWVPRLQGKVDLIPGHPNHIAFSADTPGRYEGQCGELCGMQHAHMRLVVVADTPADYARWLAHQAAPAATPTDPRLLHGEQVFETKACGLCHTIRGTRARGDVGPDLTHIGSRGAMASNSFPTTHGMLAGWSVRAQSLKPGVEMPDLTVLTGAELDALSAYLASLQ